MKPLNLATLRRNCGPIERAAAARRALRPQPRTPPPPPPPQRQHPEPTFLPGWGGIRRYY